jgi:hypothetical protein
MVIMDGSDHPGGACRLRGGASAGASAASNFAGGFVEGGNCRRHDGRGDNGAIERASYAA